MKDAGEMGGASSDRWLTGARQVGFASARGGGNLDRGVDGQLSSYHQLASQHRKLVRSESEGGGRNTVIPLSFE